MAPGANSPCVDVVFYLSALGWGLFVYYQGRSHIFNRVTMCWPALAIATVLPDQTGRMVRAGELGPVQLAMPALTLAVLMFCGIPFIQNIGPLWRDAVRMLDGRVRLPRLSWQTSWTSFAANRGRGTNGSSLRSGRACTRRLPRDGRR